MKARRLLSFATVTVAVLASLWLGRNATAPAPEPQVVESPAIPAQEPTVEVSPLVVRDVTVRDVDGRVAWHGDVDLQPVLERITAGERDEHRNDGGIFRNREGLLPQQPSGYYREYVIRTPGITHAGPQRLIVGKNGEVYYTPDHYASFQRIR